MLKLSNRDARNAVEDFFVNHSANSLVPKTTSKLAEISFREFANYLGYELTNDQIVISELVQKQKQTVVVSAHGIGKSMLASLLVLWVVMTKKGLGIVTAPTARQVKNIIFAEINRNFNKLKRNKKFQNKYGIRLDDNFSIGHTFIREIESKTKEQTKLKFWYEPREIMEDFVSEDESYEGLGYAFGFTAKSNDSNAFQGLHYTGFMLIIADEACGISFEISEAIEACATGIDNHILLIGNPIARGNPFEKSAREQGCYRVTCFTHPNCLPYYKEVGRDNWQLVDDSCLSSSYVPAINGAVTPLWIEDAREKYGTNSLFWWTRVLAKFPRLGHGTGTLIPVEFVESTCDSSRFQLSTQQLEVLSFTPLVVGVDVGESSDPTVIAVSQNIKYGNQDITLVRGIFQLDTIGDGLQAERNYQFVKDTIGHFLAGSYLTESSVTVNVDNTGLGVSLTRDLLKSHKYQVNPVHFAASANNSKTFLNVRAEMAWRLRESFVSGTIGFYESVIEPHIEQLKYEISGVSYEQDSKTEKIKLLPKEQITQILGCSTNIFDACCLLLIENK